MLVGICVYEQVYVQHLFTNLESEVSEIISVVDNSEESIKKMTEFCTKWEKKRHRLECFVSHSDLIEVELLINESLGNIQSKQTEVALSTLVRLNETLRYVAHVLSFRWEHVI